MECVFIRLAMYTKVSMTAGMTLVVVKVMVEVLRILAIATKEIDENRASELISGYELTLSVYLSSERGLRKLVGRKDIDDALQKLDKVTTVEIRIAAAATKAHNRDRIGGVESTLQGVDVEVKDFKDLDEVFNGPNTIFRSFGPSLSTFIHLGVEDSQLTEIALKNLSCCCS
jgi:hypothetical protein